MSSSAATPRAPLAERFAFVTLGTFSGINPSVLEALRAQFPELEVDHVDVRDWIRGRRALMGAALIAVIAEDGPRTVADRTRLWGAFYRTRFMQRAIARHVADRAAARGGYRFTLQTQSLFDAGVGGIAHFVYTDHSELANLRYPGFDPALIRSGRWLARERRIYEHARQTFTMSGHVSASLIEQYGIPADRVRCVHAGANVGGAADGAQPDYASRRVLFVGRDWERKGGPELIAAFTRVREQIPDATLVIVGCSPAVTIPGVSVRGELEPAEVEAEYRRAAVFCMPTRVEPFGIVFVEALAHGLPVISSDVGALPDVVSDGVSGYLHPDGDVEGLARSLAELLGDPARCRAMGEAGRAHVAAEYTWAHTAAQMADSIRAETG